MFLLDQIADNAQRLLHMPPAEELRLEDMTHNTLTIDDICDTPR